MTDLCPLCGEAVELGHCCTRAVDEPGFNAFTSIGVRVPEFAPASSAWSDDDVAKTVASLKTTYRTPEARRLYMKNYMANRRAKQKAQS